MAKVPASICFEDKKGDSFYRTLDLGPISEWGEAVAKEYIRLRSSTSNELKEISLDGITVVSVQKIRDRLRKLTVPLLRKGPLDIVRSDFGETLAYLILEENFSTAIGYKGVRDRETVNLPGRGIDIIGIEKGSPLFLILGETKVSGENKKPPAVVDSDSNSLSKQLKHHVHEHSDTSMKLWDTARKIIDAEIQEDLLRAALLWDDKRWDMLRVVCCAILVRPRALYTERDFGSLRQDPRVVRPGCMRFLVVCLPDSVDSIVSAWYDLVCRKDGTS
jgi:hypothetical protein